MTGWLKQVVAVVIPLSGIVVLSACTQGNARTAGPTPTAADLRSLLAPPPPGTATELGPGQAAVAGPLTKSAITAGQDATVKAMFDHSGFREGYGRVWKLDANSTLVTAVHEFGSGTGANEFLAYQRTAVPEQFGGSPGIISTNIPQSFGFVGLLRNQPGGVVAFAYHKWTFDVSITTTGDQLDVAALRRLATRQFDWVRSASP